MFLMYRTGRGNRDLLFPNESLGNLTDGSFGTETFGFATGAAAIG
jgi:hypothetical protein